MLLAAMLVCAAPTTQAAATAMIRIVRSIDSRAMLSLLLRLNRPPRWGLGFETTSSPEPSIAIA
jgi:hypothetical protein